MRDYNARTSRRQPTHQRPRRESRSTTTWRSSRRVEVPDWIASPLEWLQALGRQLFQGLGMVVIVGLLGLVVIWVLKANLYQLMPLKQPSTLVFLDPLPGSQTDLLVVQLASDSRKVLIYRIKNDTQTQLFSGYGTYQLASVYPLLQLDRKSDHYIRATVAAVLGVMVDQVVPVPGMAAKLDYERLTKRPQEELTRFMRPLWWQKISGVSPLVRWQWLTYLEQLDLTWVADSQASQDVAELKLEPKYAHLKGCSLAVVNTTLLKGLARRISNVFENSGLTVIRTAAEQLPETESVILYDPEMRECQPLISYVQLALPSYATARADQSLANRFRANIVVVLGQDLIGQPAAK